MIQMNLLNRSLLSSAFEWVFWIAFGGLSNLVDMEFDRSKGTVLQRDYQMTKSSFEATTNLGQVLVVHAFQEKTLFQ